MVADLVILGRGRIGTMMHELAGRAGVSATLLGRDDNDAPVARAHPGRPIVVCTRNDDLEGVLADVHPDNHADLVFVQNGLIQGWLADRGLGGCTQGVLYVAVPTVGAAPTAGGDSLFWGRHATTVAGLMQRAGVSARTTPDQDVYLREAGVKLLWICAFGVIGQATGRPVGELARDEKAAVRALVAELAPVVGHALGVVIPVSAAADEALRYARAIPDYRASLKEWAWRDGAVLAVAEELGVPLPQHTAWLARARA